MVIVCSKDFIQQPDSTSENYENYFNTFNFPLSSFQKWAIYSIVKGDHCLITAHTGSGKTLPAEFAIEYFKSKNKKVIYTGPIDKFFDYQFGKLEYRSLRWETKLLKQDNFQGNPVVNYTELNVPYTRILEHKWFDPQNQNGTVISYEYPAQYDGHNEPFYPIRDDKNTETYKKYQELSEGLNGVIFGGRLARYVYYDMHQVIAQALKMLSEFD